MSNRATGYLSTLILLIAPSLPTSAVEAAENQCAIPTIKTPDEAIQAFDALRLANCLGGENCQGDECKRVAKLNPKEQQAASTKEQTAEKILIVLRELTARARNLAVDETQLGAAQLNGMLDRWHMPTLGDTQQEAIVRLENSNKREWQGSGFDMYLNTPFRLKIDDAFQTCTVDLTCKPNLLWCATPEQCDASFKSAVAVYSISGLIHRTLDVAVRDQFNDVGTMLKQFDARWTAYHTKSLAVFPWELFVNNLAYQAASQGFSGPPNYQWLVLHPSLAVVYDDSQEDKMQEAILLDIVGRYRWTWGGKNGAEITRPFGLALAMSWSGDEPGYGLAVHLPRNWSIGVTRNKDDHTQLLFSLEFGQYLTDKQKNVDDIRKKLDDARLLR